MAAQIVTIANQKGGTGKTNVAMHLGGTLGRRGSRVAVVDTDPQNTASRWSAAAEDASPFPARVFNLGHGAKVHRELRSYVDEYDFIVVDCPAGANMPQVSSAVGVSDLLIIPVAPSPADAGSLEMAKLLASNVRGYNPRLDAVVVAALYRPASVTDLMLLQMQLDEEVPVMNSKLSHRMVYREALLRGTTVHDVPRAREARAEVDAFVDEVLARLNQERT